MELQPSIDPMALLWPVASPFEVEVDVDVNVEWAGAGVKWVAHKRCLAKWATAFAQWVRQAKLKLHNCGL